MRLLTSESVTVGHPDKVCDQISDAILDAYLAVDSRARVAVEVMATARGLVLAGEVSSAEVVDRRAVALGVVRRIGYKAYATLPLIDAVTEQSAEIGRAVSVALEAREVDNSDPLDTQGAGDQGLMYGYATEETPDLMPLPISLAHEMARRLDLLAGEGLGPDGKTQVTVAYDERGVPRSIPSVLVSVQHPPTMSASVLRRIVIARVIKPALLESGFGSPLLDHGDLPTILVNPSGSFTQGGPAVDAGLTGRKIIVDTYGGASRHGGGAFSGKDPSKVDRSGAYAARWVAKHVVAAGLASRCEVQIAYAIGVAHPVSVAVETFGTAVASEAAISSAISQVFDLRPGAIIRDLDLLRPIYFPTSVYGHFGDRDGSRPWERLSPSRLTALQLAAGGSASL